jgi:hypothetical protein
VGRGIRLADQYKSTGDEFRCLDAEGGHVSTTTGRFRVYRVFEAVPHINVRDAETGTLYTVYQSGYTDQDAVDALRTGDLIEATLSGDPTDDDEPWRIEDHEPCGGVTTDFVVDEPMPEAARTHWHEGDTQPRFVALGEDGPVGVCAIQPREALPRGAFVPNVLTGLLPLEDLFQSPPIIDGPAAEVVFVDADPPDADRYTKPYGVALVFGEDGRELADRYRSEYDLPRGEDSRPDYDPYGI